MKKRIFAIAMIIACLAILTSTTVAYFTTSDTARNVITSGGVKVAIVEQQRVGEKLLPYAAEPIKVMPSQSMSKIVSVQSLDNTAWIRMRYTVTVKDTQGAPLNVTQEQIASVVQITADSSNWTYQNGWWYYNQALKRGELTTPLFDKVVFSNDMGNIFQGSTVDVKVMVEAVQSANNGSTVLEADGWPGDEA